MNIITRVYVYSTVVKKKKNWHFDENLATFLQRVCFTSVFPGTPIENFILDLVPQPSAVFKAFHWTWSLPLRLCKWSKRTTGGFLQEYSEEEGIWKPIYSSVSLQFRACTFAKMLICPRKRAESQKWKVRFTHEILEKVEEQRSPWDVGILSHLKSHKVWLLWSSTWSDIRHGVWEIVAEV